MENSLLVTLLENPKNERFYVEPVTLKGKSTLVVISRPKGTTKVVKDHPTAADPQAEAWSE